MEMTTQPASFRERRFYRIRSCSLITTKGKGAQSEETPDAFEGVEDVLCRLAQTHPTQTPERWELITQKLNRAMRNKKISAQPMKDIFAKEGLCIPQCWVAEKTQAEKDRALARGQKSAEKKKGALGRTLFGKQKTVAAAVAGSDRNRTGEAQAVGEVKADEANEADTETESDEDVADHPAARTEGGASVYKYKALSKYEVFSFMRRVHDRAGAAIIETEEAVEDMREAKKMVDMLYEHLPVQTVKEISQQNRINANLMQDSVAYGEIDISHFLKVMVKLKRIHGNMMSAGGSFWDLGSGVGKCVIAAAMMHNWEPITSFSHICFQRKKSCYGVECLEDLRAAARPTLERWRKEEVLKLNSVKAKIRVDFINADAMNQKGWVAEATLLFVHTNFSAKDIIEIKTKADGMKVRTVKKSTGSCPAILCAERTLRRRSSVGNITSRYEFVIRMCTVVGKIESPEVQKDS
ncbi:unnamed protein product [Ectocarpus sp. CCAP 1310/34]|nr:unnamed protein product [Ectocarpus sp. CCAP 1310/34]